MPLTLLLGREEYTIKLLCHCLVFVSFISTALDRFLGSLHCFTLEPQACCSEAFFFCYPPQLQLQRLSKIPATTTTTKLQPLQATKLPRPPQPNQTYISFELKCLFAHRPINRILSKMAAPVPHKKKIAVMTSGGDSPGMNAVVRAVVRMAIHKDCDAFCVYEGYEGLVRGGDYMRQMKWSDVRGWLSEGGTLIGTARCLAFYERPGRLQAAKNMVLNGIDALIICGGDGSLTGADKFRSEWPSLLDELVSTGELVADQVTPYKHLNIVGLVGSIDNDLAGTDATIGCYSALARICEMVDYIEATASSHSRAFVIEVMGRHCGWLALLAGVATGADFVFIPERPIDKDWKEDMCVVVKRVRFPCSYFIFYILYFIFYFSFGGGI